MRRGPLVCDLPDAWRPEPEDDDAPERDDSGPPVAVEADDCPEGIEAGRAWTAERAAKGAA